MKARRILALLLTLVLAFGALTACAGEKEPAGNETEAPAGGDRLILVAGGEPIYSVIRPDIASDAVVKAAVSCRAAMSKLAGKDAVIDTDWVKEEGEKKPEILIGDTNREESKTAKEGLAADGYRITVVGNKLCVVADGDKAMALAVDALLALIPESGDFSVEKTLNLTGAYVPKGPVVNIYDKNTTVDFKPLETLFEDPDSVVLKDVKTGIGSSLGMHFADFIVVNDVIWAYYIEWIDGEAGVALATSEDGVNFTKVETVLRPSEDDWDNQMASFPGIWYEDGTYYLVYEGTGAPDKDNRGAVGLATSKDGIHFEKQGCIIDYRHDGKGLYGANVGTPDIFRLDGTWYVTFHTFDWTDCMICYASGDDLMDLELYEGNPIIPTDKKPTDPASGTTGRRDVMYYDGWFYMVYEISTEQPYDDAHWCHMFARSQDFEHWEKVGPIIDQTEHGYGNDGPAFLVMNDQIFVYYRVGGSMSRYRLAF